MAKDKVAVVAGVGPGIGARFVESFANDGYRVAALARNSSSLEQIRAGLGATAERCAFWTTDITDQEQVKKTFLRVRNELGPVDLLICNAGGRGQEGFVFDISRRTFSRISMARHLAHSSAPRRRFPICWPMEGGRRLHRRHQLGEGLREILGFRHRQICPARIGAM